MEFQGKTAISTGAASGMGLLFAQNWAALGGNVIMCDVNEKVLNEKVEEINSKNGGRAIGMICDVRDYAQVCRTNIWREMKSLCDDAGVNPQKVFPHNLRHLFARTFYSIEKDIAKLADILGHSSINTTRIYIISTGTEHRRRMENMRLIL